MILLARRAFLLMLGALAPARWLQRRQRELTFADFLRLSERLTGRTRLEEEAGRRYFASLTASPDRRVLLADLAHEGGAPRTPAHLALERDLIAAWYTGVHQVDGAPRLATHTGALMWGALGMPAPGVCVGTGAPWSRPPVR